MKVEFIYRKDEPFRIIRLAKTFSEIAKELPKECQYIESMEDHEGLLTVIIKENFLKECFNIKIVEVIKNSWENQNEHCLEIYIGSEILLFTQN